MEPLFLEDVRPAITPRRRILALLGQCVPPSAINSQLPAINEESGRDPLHQRLRGRPKGVELTHGNLLANIRQMLAVSDVMDTDRVFNALPLFHSFGIDRDCCCR